MARSEDLGRPGVARLLRPSDRLLLTVVLNVEAGSAGSGASTELPAGVRRVPTIEAGDVGAVADGLLRLDFNRLGVVASVRPVTALGVVGLVRAPHSVQNDEPVLASALQLSQNSTIDSFQCWFSEPGSTSLPGCASSHLRY